MQPTIGRIVHYKLSASDCEQINKRRTDYSKADKSVDTGFQAHICNMAREGAVVPLIVTTVWAANPDDIMVNGQAFLDGNDTLWVTSAHEDKLPPANKIGAGERTEQKPGGWSWPPRV